MDYEKNNLKYFEKACDIVDDFKERFIRLNHLEDKQKDFEMPNNHWDETYAFTFTNQYDISFCVTVNYNEPDVEDEQYLEDIKDNEDAWQMFDVCLYVMPENPSFYVNATRDGKNWVFSEVNWIGDFGEAHISDLEGMLSEAMNTANDMEYEKSGYLRNCPSEHFFEDYVKEHPEFREAQIEKKVQDNTGFEHLSTEEIKNYLKQFYVEQNMSFDDAFNEVMSIDCNKDLEEEMEK